jgi:formylglycine-generating enzyme required for sulfatase activity
LTEFKDVLQDYCDSSSKIAKSSTISELSTVKALKSLHSSANSKSWQSVFISTLSKISINRRQMLTHSGTAIAGFVIASLLGKPQPKPQPLAIVTPVPAPEVPLDPIKKNDNAFRDTFGDNIYVEMVKIPSGKFIMGSPVSEIDRKDHESPLIEVNLSAFYMAKFVVTQEQWVAIMGANPAIFRQDLQAPMENISWLEAKEFCQKLSLKSAYKYTYRLPSEAEWEYACRAGTNTAYHFGDRSDQLPDYAWFKDNANQRSQPIGKKIPNPWGLHEMHGGVWEWCEDVWHDSYRGAPADGSAWVDGEGYGRRVRRGGSWSNEAKLCRAASRDWHWQGDRYSDIGLRVVI